MGPPSGDELIRYWEGIAEALQVSVKTAQRYEKEFGLPIRRKRGAKGTVIYALRSELNAWLATGPARPASEEAAPPQHTQTSKRVALWWAAAGLALLCGVLVLLTSVPFSHREAANWRTDQQRLSVIDARGALLWSHVFDFPLLPPESLRPPVSVGEFVDIDGDGRKEFLFLAMGTDEYKRSFYCFNDDGSVRFSVMPGQTITRTVRFGDDDFAPPFGVQRFLLADEPGGRKSVLVISYDPTWFPSVVQKYSASGKLLGEFWNPGRIYEAKVIDLGTRRLLFVGATNNELHAGSLAVLDWNHPSGFGPATIPHYQCLNCPPGTPLAYFVFPEMEVSRVINAWPTVWRVHLDAPDWISVHVLQTREPLSVGGPPGLIGAAVYGLDRQLRLRSAELVEGYRVVHSALQTLGRIDHPVGPQDEKELLPVLRWNGRAFDRILPVP